MLRAALLVARQTRHAQGPNAYRWLREAQGMENFITAGPLVIGTAEGFQPRSFAAAAEPAEQRVQARSQYVADLCQACPVLARESAQLFAITSLQLADVVCIAF